ncbi:MAG: ferredoxin--NADP reductase, partial [Gammaproteobacteria bacterium]|nr:ferredoxin--NADP reductase [Gammaproteobacteria bacterium]MCY4295667.1 ferredoxin--NADP reductase [Gammaproteobacteria bacterium]
LRKPAGSFIMARWRGLAAGGESMAQWIEGTIVNNERWTENLFSIQVEADTGPFTAGQFTSLALDIGGKRVARPYSYLNPPGACPLEFFMYRIADGALTSALIDMGPGEKVWVKSPANGFLVLPEVPPCEDMWMLATGTGIAPFFSILNTEEPWRRFERVVLIHAVRWEVDLRYREIVESFKQRYGDRFVFQAFVSREQVPGAIHGRVPATIGNGELERRTGVAAAPEKSHFMLCGNPGMIGDTTEALLARGFTRNRRRAPGHITSENYW